MLVVAAAGNITITSTKHKKLELVGQEAAEMAAVLQLHQVFQHSMPQLQGLRTLVVEAGVATQAIPPFSIMALPEAPE
jgi:type III secretory pathway lipoprotein EscJ